MPLLLTDDLAARDAVKRLSLNPVGSLGVIVHAFQQELISLDEAERFLSELYSVSGLFVTRDTGTSLKLRSGNCAQRLNEAVELAE